METFLLPVSVPLAIAMQMTQCGSLGFAGLPRAPPPTSLSEAEHCVITQSLEPLATRDFSFCYVEPGICHQ